MPIELTALIVAAVLALIQALGLWILTGIRGSIRDLWTTANETNGAIHAIDKRVAVMEASIERRRDAPLQP